MRRILKSTFFFAAIAVAAFVLQSCNSVKPVDKAKLEGNWVLKTLQGEDAKTAFTGDIPSIKFDFENSTVAGSGGCNRYNGAFTLTDKNEFSAPKLVSTMRMCLNDNKEPQFLKALSTPNLAVSLENDMLTFKQAETVLLQFEKGEEKTAVAAPTAEALSGKWALTSISGGDVATLFATNKPTMEISADGKVFGNAGCNNYRSTFTLEESNVTFGPVMSTKMACPSLEGEQIFTSLLGSPLQVALIDNKLAFSKDGNTVLEFEKAE